VTAAHGLETPLSILNQLTADAALEAYPELAKRLGQQLDLMHERVERELKWARLMGAAAPGRGFNPGADLTPLVAALKAAHRDRQLSIATRAPQLLAYPVDREDMLELLGNLLDNACELGTGKVCLTLSEEKGLHIIVEDDGSGIEEAKLVRLSSRGERLDESVPGHGLGLAIVHDIVKFYGGRITFERAPELGGLLVRVDLSAPFASTPT
jgi:signal transduction histidine kinase